MLELAAVVLGLVGVALMTRQIRVGWLVGVTAALVSVAFYYESRFYSQMLLNLAYVGLQLYGWASWGRPEKDLSRSSWKVWPWLVVGAGLSFALARLMLELGARQPLADASITVYSMIAQLWMAHRRRACWLLFGLADLGAAVMLGVSGFNLMAGLYLAYLTLAVVGYLSWQD